MYSPGTPSTRRPEPFGAVSTPLSQRRSYNYSTPDYAAYMAPITSMSSPAASFPPSSLHVGASPLQSPTILRYSHNTIASIWLGIPLLMLLYFQESSYMMQALLFVSLALYALDLANAREAAWGAVWLAFPALSITHVWNAFLQHGVSLLWTAGVDILLFLCWACFVTLQFQWLHRETPLVATMMQLIVHSIAPVVSASVVVHLWIRFLPSDWAYTLVPHLWSLFLCLGMLFLGSSLDSYSQLSDRNKPNYILAPSQAQYHSLCLLLLPPLMYIVAFRKRIFSLHASFDEWYDLLLVCSVPYLMHYCIHLLHQSGTIQGPYSLPRLFPQTSATTPRGALVPMFVSMVASLSFQQAYWIPWCQAISYQFNGHDLPSTTIVSSYLTIATFTTLLATWVWGRKSAQTGELLFGEYHEDIVQFSLAITGLCVGKAFGMPWNLTPLPILAFLGLSVWISTRMLRYLAIFLFVVHSACLVLFSYRFAGMHSKIPLAIPGTKLGLTQFAMLIVGTSIVVGLVVGLAVRASGGVGWAIMKKIDVTGTLLILYAVALTMLECTLLTHPVPFRDLMGVEAHDDSSELDVDAMIYGAPMALMTSAVLAGLTWFMHRFKIISARRGVIVLSVALGKAVAVFIDTSRQRTEAVKNGDKGNIEAVALLIRSLVAAGTIVVVLAPRAFLQPVHVKSTARYKRDLGPSGKSGSVAHSNVGRVIVAYALLILPLTLIASIPMVLMPLVETLSGHYGGAYYGSSPAPSELVGFALTLWGLSCLSMLNHYLPDGGGEVWKKASALTFLMGVGITVSAPTIPDWIGGESSVAASNPYASISSMGSLLLAKGRSKSGGWGILSASLATLLALTGPLELQERRESSGRKDSLLLFRLMVFSVMFGCGVAWFITMQCMSEESFLPVFVTTTACMSMSFFGTVAGVLGYFLELENFDEVSQVAKVWAGSFPLFGLIAATSQFEKGTAHPFGMGGWLSTYLFVCACVALAFALVVRARPSKNPTTRGLGNLSCVLAWMLAVIILYGRYGIAGLDAAFDVTSFVGIPVSVIGTFATSLILLALEGEMSPSRRTKIQRLSGSAHQNVQSSFGINFQTLGSSNSVAPSITASVFVLVCASTYAIFLRGCGWLAVPTGHEDVFAGVFGKGRTTIASSLDGLSSLIEKSLTHQQAVVASAKLAGGGFWTSDNVIGPLLHLGGLVATLPSLYLFVSFVWSADKISTSKVVLALPLNCIPIVLCKGIPTLRAGALVGLVGGTIQLFATRQHDKQSKMRI